MTHDDIIRMAHHCDLGPVCGPLDTLLDHEWESLHRFAALVAAHEREACARVCDDYGNRSGHGGIGFMCAEAIRARGEA